MAKNKTTPGPRAHLKRTPPQSETSFIAFLVTLLVAIVAVVGIVLAASGETTGPAREPVMTLQPQIALNLTRLPQATPLSGDAAAELDALRAMVDACGDYRAERRRQMHQHIDWLIDPSDIPPDVVVALGANPTGRLIFGMATYTSSEWRLGGRNPDSCLVPIGRLLNDMLLRAGEEPFGIYDEAAPQ